MAAFNLKAGLNPITTLLLQTNNLAEIQQELKAKIEQAPNMFIRLPCIFDFIELEEKIDLPSLYLVCHEFGMLPIGVKNAQTDHHELLEQLELADFGKGKSRIPKASQTTETASHNNAKIEAPITDASTLSVNTNVKTTIHKFPIRSGQQLTAEGDLIIFGLVSTGAEVLAGGSIHIYGPLRGRALAGINGNSDATISCQSLEAELVAIAGEYKLFENSELHTTQATFIQLDNGRLNIESV
ncbi:MAG TPA: septum site-determining protein MinC [Oceanospirillales bacterium]|jgi:septum site-determining protein MinC|nr:septum site-determining protein MinC [Oleispira sp.]HCM05000.1 septum site-determining protein MinC [Oceanospirillales bacterium]|tara:strand:- start:7221 stop:7943 length:723 start_codon:yes stop_codon:yes gene_type:complete